MKAYRTSSVKLLFVFLLFLLSGSSAFAGDPVKVKGKVTSVTVDPPINGPGTGTVVIKCVGNEGTCALIDPNKRVIVFDQFGTTEQWSFDTFKIRELNNEYEIEVGNAQKIP